MMRCLLILMLFIFAAPSFGQQLPRFLLYQDNLEVINPASVGKEMDKIKTALSLRKEWMDFDGAPNTQYANASLRLTDLNMGLGAALYSDQVGPERKTGAKLSYAYHIQLQNDQFLSLGLSVGGFQSKIDFEALDFDFKEDPVAFSEAQTSTSFEVDLGGLFYTENTFVGISIPQATNTQTRYTVDTIEAIRKMVRHYHIMVGHQLEVTDKFQLLPSSLLSSVDHQALLVDVGLRMIFLDKFWCGANYRSEGSFALSAGFDLTDKFNLGYSYEVNGTRLGAVSKGTQELVLSYDFPFAGKFGGKEKDNSEMPPAE